MFVGRTKELADLRRLSERGGFQMAVVYGRRRVGKTALIREFAKDRPCLFFTAQQKSDVANLRTFSQAVYGFFDLPEDAGAFTSWDAALSFIVSQAPARGPFVFVFDEFPYAALANPSLPSTLQIAIDHGFAQTDVTMILCGSNEGFMASEVLGSKSPLYGRRTLQIRLKPLGYREAAELMPASGPEELVRYYATFGGTPYYLLQIDSSQTYEQNVERLFFDISGILYAEPQMLLRQELREPAVYSSVLDAVGSGATIPKRIAERAGVDENSIGRYLKTLVDLGIVERVVPFNEGRGGRKSLYRIADPFFSYWYRFVSPHANMIEGGLGSISAGFARDEALATYVGKQFEGICLQWLLARAAAGELAFVPMEFGTWWGPDPEAHEQVDVDVVMANAREGWLLAGECKWRNSFNETEAIATLEHRAQLIGDYANKVYYLFSKQALSSATMRKVAGEAGLNVVTARELYE